jgi:putative transposase
MDLLSTYFFTATILNWYHLLKTDGRKQIVLDSLRNLVEREAIKLYGFVIMPNHIHLILRNLQMNGKEFPQESLLKFTGHRFKQLLAPQELKFYKVSAADRMFQFWQRNSLPVLILSRAMLEQKLDYTHYNPLQAHWKLVEDPSDYYYSSCSFYEREDRRFSWLTDYREDFT